MYSSPFKKFYCKNELKNDCFVTPLSLRHVYSGYILALISYILLSNNILCVFVISNIIHLFYEIKDYVCTYIINNRESGMISGDIWGGNSFYNSLGDQTSCNLGIIIFLFIKNTITPSNSTKILVINLLLYFSVYFIESKIRPKQYG